MEILDLSQKKKAFAPPKQRFKNPHKEALKLRPLWSNYQPPSRSKEMLMARALYKQVSKDIENEERWEEVRRTIIKGLCLNPRFHGFYALRGHIYKSQGKLTKAIKDYETARRLTKYDSKVSKTEAKILYNKQLIECYTNRGEWYHENNMLLEAMGDYEQVLVLKLRAMNLEDIQDKLLDVLRTLDKYVVFERYFEEFITNVGAKRASALLSRHAEYKIYRREIVVARHMLYEAINLDQNNAQAQELLQVVFKTGHIMTSYSIVWCMHGCYDKGLAVIEKALDCNPYNPGFNLIKAIILRMSGRLEEANSWLETISKNFHKMYEPSKDQQESITGKLSISETRHELIRQWYLIRYEMAMKCMLSDKLETAARIIYGSNLTKYFAESYILLGDSFFKRGNIELALKSYLDYRKRARELGLPASGKSIDVTERIIDILNERTEIATHKGHSKMAISMADEVLRILDDDQIEMNKLGPQRGHALLYKTRGLFQLDKKSKKKSKKCCETAADSLRFVREPDDAGLYQTLYGNTSIEDTIDRFAPERKLPQSLKILMQFS